MADPREPTPKEQKTLDMLKEISLQAKALGEKAQHILDALSALADFVANEPNPGESGEPDPPSQDDGDDTTQDPAP